MKRSEEIEALANRTEARACSMFFPDQPAMKADLKAIALALHDYATLLRAKEHAAHIGNGRGGEHPPIAPTIGG